ncbi:MAG: lamin tail domain-containing protein, partial [Thermoplasmatales archaeon]|nr:lamin tail domain-containing protein [Thermoplasmatales archaeon]
MGIGRLSRDRGGNMPFAMIAVVLLVMGTAYGIVCADIERADDAAAGVEDEMISLGDAKEAFVREAEASLGAIIADLSRAETGTIGDRCAMFSGRAADYFSNEFPKTDRGVTVTVAAHDVKMTVQRMMISDGTPAGGAVPSYLRASGHADVTFESVRAVSNERVDLSADGTSGLPLLVEGATRFELAAGTGSAMLEQLVSYQLSALAQKRIMDGHGTAYSPTTASIITRADVSRALHNAVSILETICFRDGSSIDGLGGAVAVDAADLLMSENGLVEVDLSAIFAQTLVALTETIVGHWLSYMHLDTLLGYADRIVNEMTKYVEKAVDFVKGYLTKLFPNHIRTEAEFDIAAFLSKAMSDNGVAVSEYRNPFSGKFHTVAVPAARLSSGGTAFEFGGMAVDVPFVDADPVAWDGWKSFDGDTDGDRGIRVTLERIVQSVAHEISKNKTLGRVVLPVDPYDSVSFTDAFVDAVSEAFTGNAAALRRSIHKGVDEGNIPDPLYASVCETLSRRESEIFSLGSYTPGYVEDHVRKAVSDRLGALGYVDPGAVDGILSGMDFHVESKAMGRAAKRISRDTLALYHGVSVEVARQQDSFYKTIVSSVISMGMDRFDVTPEVRRLSFAVCGEAFSSLGSNPYSTPVELPGGGPFVLRDKNGNRYRETVSVSSDVDGEITIIQPKDNKGKNVEFVGFDRSRLAGFTSVFTVKIKADLGYRATSGTEILTALGTSDASLSGSVPVDMVIDVPVVSGWALHGVPYGKSSDIFSDAWKLLLEAVEPLMGPLRQVFKAIEHIMNACTTAIMQAAEFMQKLVMEMYEAISVPLEALRDLVNDALGHFGDIAVAAMGIGLGSQSVTFAFFDHRLTLETNAKSWKNDTKSIVRVTMEKASGDRVRSAYVDLKKKGDDFLFTAGGKATGNGWDFNIDIDPFMRGNGEAVTVDGILHGVRFSASSPKVVQYQKMEIRLSQVPAVGSVLSNIPIPVPGYKGSLDIGASLKYNLPTKSGLVINEFESNPAGRDSGNEWVELYNNGDAGINLEGYSLVPQSNKAKRIVLPAVDLARGSRAVFHFAGTSLNNGDSGKGESVRLVSPDGRTVDQTPWKTDTHNDGRTWQRSFDG